MYRNLLLDKLRLAALVLAAALLASAIGCTNRGTDGVQRSLAFVTTVVGADSDAVLPPILVAIEFPAGGIDESSSAEVTVSLESSPAGGTLRGTLSVVADRGVAAFTDLRIDRPGAGYRLRVESAGIDAAVSNTFSIVAVDPPAITSVTADPGPAITDQPGADSWTAEVALGQPLGFRVVGDHPYAGEPLQYSVAVTGGNLTAVQAGFDQPFPTPSGNAPLDLLLSGTAATPGTIELTITVEDSSGLQDIATLAIQINPATGVAFATEPSDVDVLDPVTPAVTVELVDTNGHRVLEDGVAVSMVIDTNPASPPGVLGGTTMVTTIAGVATFSSLTFSQPGVGYRLRAESAGLVPAVSAAFTVSGSPVVPSITGVLADPGPAVVTGPDINGDFSAEVALGQPLGFRITATHTLPAEPLQYSVAVTGGNLTAVQAGFNQPFPTTSGTAPLDLLLSGTAATTGTIELTITVEDSRNAPDSIRLTIQINGPSSMGFSVQPTDTDADANISPAIEVSLYDVNGHHVRVDGTSIGLSIESNGGSPPGQLSGTAVVQTVNGVVVFDSLSIDQPGAGYRLQASSAGLPAVLSNFFSITGDAPVLESVVAESGPAVINGPLNHAVAIEVALGQPLDFLLTANHPSPGEQLSATVTVTGGDLTATDAGFDQPFDTPAGAAPLQLQLTGTAATAGTIVLSIDYVDEASVHTLITLTLQIHDAVALGFLTPPSDVLARARIKPIVQVELLDPNGHRVVKDGVPIGIVIGANPVDPPANLFGDSYEPTVAGVAWFPGLNIRDSADGYTLIASSPPLAPVESPPFRVGPTVPEATALFLPDHGSRGTHTGCVPVSYIVEQPDSLPVDVLVEFSLDAVDWRPASPAPSSPGQEGWLGRSTSPGGDLHVWMWDSARDLPRGGGGHLRITPMIEGLPGNSWNRPVGAVNGHRFTPQTPAPTGTSPYAIVSADINNDGLDDFLVANVDSDDVSLYLQRAAEPGTFDPEIRLPAGDAPRSLAVGDLNGDGFTDYVVALLNDDEFQVWLQDSGNPLTFIAGPTLVFDITPLSVEVADLDGDDRLEVLAACQGHLSLAVFWQTPGPAAPGSFGVPELFDVQGVSDIVVADVSHDGLPDIVASREGSSQVKILLQDDLNPGTFLATQNWALIDNNIRDFQVVDLDGDSRLDIVAVHNGGPGVYTYSSVLWGSFLQPGSFPDETVIPITWRCEALTVADFDGDGHLDIAGVASDYGHLHLVRQSAPRVFHRSFFGVTGDQPLDIVSGEFSGEGLPDLALVCRGSHELQIWRSDGGRPCGSPILAPFGFRPRRQTSEPVAIGDFNEDGKLDLVVINAPAAMHPVMYGDGAGGWIEGPSVSAIGTHIATADLDRDGHLDLVIGASGALRIRPGNGDGTFGSGVDYSTDDARRGNFIADANGDGWLDILVDVPGTGVEVWLQNSGSPGTFALHHTEPITPKHLRVADVTGDGHPDLVWLETAGEDDLHVRPGDGTGAFGSETEIPLGADTARSVVTGDLTGDGVADIAVSVGTNVVVYRSNGDGTFATPITSPIAGVKPSHDLNHHNWRVVDVDRDGHNDILVHGRAELAVYLGDSTGTLTDQTLGVIGTRDELLGVADFNGDGQPDALLDDYLVVQVPGSPGVFDLPTGASDSPDSSRQLSVHVADFDLDGTLDVVAFEDHSDGAGGSVTRVMRQDPAEPRTFTPLAVVTETAVPVAAVVADFDGDDLPDIVIGDRSARLRVWRQVTAAPGTFHPVTSYATNGIRSMAAADIDRDGHVDVVVGSGNVAGIAIHFGNGDGTFDLPVSVTARSGVESIRLVDMNGDGWLDIVAGADPHDFDVVIQDSASPGTFFAPTSYVTRRIAFLAVGDLNQDGLPDVAVGDADLRGVSVYFHDPAAPGTLLAPVVIAVPYHADSVEIGDINRDGRSDLVVGNIGGGLYCPTFTVVYQTADSPGTFGVPQLIGSGRRPTALSIADLDRDGYPDVLIARSAAIGATGGPAIYWGR